MTKYSGSSSAWLTLTILALVGSLLVSSCYKDQPAIDLPSVELYRVDHEGPMTVRFSGFLYDNIEIVDAVGFVWDETPVGLCIEGYNDSCDTRHKFVIVPKERIEDRNRNTWYFEQTIDTGFSNVPTYKIRSFLIFRDTARTSRTSERFNIRSHDLSITADTVVKSVLDTMVTLATSVSVLFENVYPDVINHGIIYPVSADIAAKDLDHSNGIIAWQGGPLDPAVRMFTADFPFSSSEKKVPFKSYCVTLHKSALVEGVMEYDTTYSDPYQVKL